MTPLIEGVQLIPLNQIMDDRGKVMHMLRCDASHFQKFGEIYFSWIHPGVIKGWSLHKEMTMNYAVPVGHVKVVLYDERSNSKTKGVVQELYLSPDSYYLLTVPPKIWYGLKGMGSESSMIANCSTIPHDPVEILRKDPFDLSIPYEWS